MQKVVTRFITPFLLVSTLFGCSAFSSARTTLATIQDAAIAARMTIRPVIDAYCEAAQAECDKDNKLTPAVALLAGHYQISNGDCPAYDACNRARLIIINTLEAVQFAIADANLAISLGQEERYEVAVARALELLAQVQKQMELLGIIPGADDGKA